MAAASGRESGGDPVPRIAPGCNPLELPLSPAEGYLLSRVDGCTPRSLLREIGGMPAQEVDRCLERWAKEGILELAGETRTPSASGAASESDGASAAAVGAPGGAGPAFDECLDIPVEFQREILTFFAKLEAPYHEILGIDAAADNKAIKKAYFGLSKKYHPDRYFRRNLGPFAELIQGIFRRVLEAYELLSDPATRAEVQRDLTTSGEAAKSAPGAADAKTTEEARSGAGAPQGTRPATPRIDAREAARRLRGLRRRSGGLGERKRKAKGFFESGMAAFRAERWLEAAGSVRLAIAFDPHNAAFREAFAEVQTKAHEERAKVLAREAQNHLDLRAFQEALRCYEEAIQFRPFDAELLYKASRLAYQLGADLRKAKEWAQTACELEPDKAPYRRVLGQIYKGAGLRANARRELQAALRLDPKDAEAAAELKGL